MARYIISLIIVLLAKLFTIITAPILAVCIVWRNEDYKPVATKLGIKRPFLIPILYPLQPFDDALDSYWWWKSKSVWLRKYFNQEYYDNHRWLQWYCRVLWLWRNSAYGVAYKLGFDQQGLAVTKDNDPHDVEWDKKIPCKLVRKFTNAKGRKGFLYRARFRLPFKYYYEVVLGYKAPWSDYQNAMLASRIFKIGKL